MKWFRVWFCIMVLAQAGPAADSSPSPPPAPYTRVVQPDTNTVALQLALRRFAPTGQRGGTQIWLAAVSHIGETNYYLALQKFLGEQTLVLFEGIGGPQDLKRRSRHLRAGGTDEARGSSAQEPEGLQATLAASLGLAFQLDAIDYDQPHFQNSDLTLGQLERLLTRYVEQQGETGAGMPNPAFLALMGAMDGTSWLGMVFHAGARLLGSSPKLTAMTRLMFIEILGQLKGDLAQVQGLPPDMQELIQVLIRERNQVVLRDLQQIVHRSQPPASVAVFYGAGHMDDLEKRLRAELGYQPSEDRWVTAIEVQPARAGLTEAEIKVIRSLIEWQMKSLASQPGDQAGEPEGAAPADAP